MSAKPHGQAQDSDGNSQVIAKSFMEAYALVKKVAEHPEEQQPYNEAFEFVRFLDGLDPKAQNSKLQLVIGSIAGLVETIQNLSQYEQFSKENGFYRRQTHRALSALTGLLEGYQTNDQKLFDRNYTLLLLDSYAFDVYEGTFILNQELTKLENNLQDKAALRALVTLGGSFLPQADYAGGSNGRMLVRSLCFAIQTVVDYWNKSSDEDKKQFIRHLETMGRKIVPLLDLPTFQDLETYQEALKQISGIGAAVLNVANMADSEL